MLKKNHEDFKYVMVNNSTQFKLMYTIVHGLKMKGS